MKRILGLSALLAVWAVSGQPLIVDSHTRCLLGGWDGTHWVSKPPVAGERRYRIFLADGEEESAPRPGGAPKPIEGPCGDSQEVPFTPDLPDGSIAVSGERAKRVATESVPLNSRFYVSAFRSLLDRRGVRSPVRIEQLLRVDLDGDGRQEVLASLYGVKEEGPVSHTGDYAAIVLRRVDEHNRVSTQVVDFESHPRKDGVTHMTIGPLVSLKGDGEVQVLIRGRFTKGMYSHLYELRKGKLVRVLECTCGE
jgi:hypothetical protein